MFALQIYTANLLGRSWTMAEELEPDTMAAQDRYPYAALARLTLGRRPAQFVAFLLDFTVFSAGIPNIIVAAQSLQLFGLKMSENLFDFSYCYWIIILGVLQCPIMWLGSPKDMKCISVISVVIVATATVMTSLCIFYDDRRPIMPTTGWRSITNTTTWDGLISTYGIIAFQFDIHPLLLTIQVDMYDRRKITKAVIGAFFFSSVMFGATTILAVIRYGANVDYNILKELPASSQLYFTVLLITMQLSFTAAVCNSALYQDIEDLLGISRAFNYKRCLIRTLIMCVSLVLAESVPRFDIVMGLIGGTLTGPLMFILPSLYYIKMLLLRRNYTPLEPENIMVLTSKSNSFQDLSVVNEVITNPNQEETNTLFKCKPLLLPAIVFVFGTLITIVTTIYSIRDTVKYAKFRPPCLLNVSAASMGIFD